MNQFTKEIKAIGAKLATQLELSKVGTLFVKRWLGDSNRLAGSKMKQFYHNTGYTTSTKARRGKERKNRKSSSNYIYLEIQFVIMLVDTSEKRTPMKTTGIWDISQNVSTRDRCK